MMTEICCSKRGWRRSACPYKAKVEVDGKHYCGVHDPRKAEARRAKQDAVYNAEKTKRGIENEIAALRQELVAWALAHPEALVIRERWVDVNKRLMDANEKLWEISR